MPCRAAGSIRSSLPLFFVRERREAGIRSCGSRGRNFRPCPGLCRSSRGVSEAGGRGRGRKSCLCGRCSGTWGRERMRSHLFGWGKAEAVCGRRDYRGRSGAVRRAGPWRGRLSGGVFRMMCRARCGTGAGPDAAGLRRESSARGAGAGCAGDPSALSLCAKSAR